MSVLTQWHNLCATCAGSRAARVDVPCLKMKALSGRLLQHVTGCKRQTAEDGRRSVSRAADGFYTFSSGQLKQQHPNAPTVTLPDIKLLNLERRWQKSSLMVFSAIFVLKISN